ncbi:hypothetical protein EV175_000913, partial [Coemansia sp. RSA 1933]
MPAHHPFDQQTSLLFQANTAVGMSATEATPLTASANDASMGHLLFLNSQDEGLALSEEAGYGTTTANTQPPLTGNDTVDQEEASAYEIADDHNPVTAFYEIMTIRRLLLEYVGVVLSPGQIHSPDVQINLITPLWQSVRERCGVWRPGDMRHQRTSYTQSLVDSLDGALQAIDAQPGAKDSVRKKVKRKLCDDEVKNEGGPLPSAAMLYATLANRDYFIVLASAGQSQAELHQSRAEIAESLAVICAKALSKLGRQVLIDALCVKYTPIDIDALRVGISVVHKSPDQQIQRQHNDETLRRRNVYMRSRDDMDLLAMISGERHMSLLSGDQRVRVYRLGKAGDISLDHNGAESPTLTLSTGMSSRSNSGYATPIREMSQEYLSGGSRILCERALEVAIRSEAKRFCAQKLVGEVVHLLWNGSVHWKGFSCVCLKEKRVAEPSDESSPHPILKISFIHRTNASDDEAPTSEHLPLTQQPLEMYRRRWRHSLEVWLAHVLEPLRIPMFENILTMVHAFFFLWLYTLVSLERNEQLTVLEVMLHVCALAYIADEIRQCRENGISVYMKSVWNVLDVSIYGIFIAFFALRIRSLYTGLQDDLDKAYDVLALNASMLWPRLFSVLDQFEFFGTIIIQVRRIIAGTSLFFALLLVMTTGFFQTFFSLSKRHNDMEAKNIWALMTKIFFGSALLGWDHADLFGPYVGYAVMSMYIGVSMLILYNILIGVINQCMIEIRQNSAQEFRFAYTMRIAEYVSAKQTYPCVPPLNLLQLLVFWPLRKAAAKMPPHSFALFRSLVLLVAYMPHLLMYRLFKFLNSWWKARSGVHQRSLRAECGLSEKELAMIKIRKADIDEYAFSNSTDDDNDVAENGLILATQKTDSGRYSTSFIRRQPNTGLSQRSLAKSPTLIANDTELPSRWTSLMDAWKQHRKPDLHAAEGSSANTDEAKATAEKRIAQLETKMVNIDKKLDIITQLLQP